jgi:hypothetical protein
VSVEAARAQRELDRLAVIRLADKAEPPSKVCDAMILNRGNRG